MIYLPIDITIHLNTKYGPKDIWNFFFNTEFKERLLPLHIWKPNQILPTLDVEDYMKEFQASTLKKNASLQFEFNELIEPSHVICSAFKNKTKNSDEFLNLAHFLHPGIDYENNKLHLKWINPQPAVILEVHYTDYDSGPVFYTKINISHGLWGTRYNWLEAIKLVLSQLKEKKKSQINWSEEKEIFESLEKQTNEIKDFETNILDFNETRTFFWKLASEIVNKFCESDESAFISPNYFRKLNKNVDIITYRLEKLPKDPLTIPDTAWVDLAWNDFLNWSTPEPLKQSVIQYWSEYKDEERFLEMIRTALGGGKAMWPAIVEIITKRPETDKMLERLIGWVADPNWPGAGEAWNHLLNVVGIRSIPIIEEKILYAEKIGDDWWKEILIDLKENIETKYKQKSK